MQLNPTDVRIDHVYLGAGKGSEIRAVHLPTGIVVTEPIPSSSSELRRVVTQRLISRLKTKIQENPSRELS